MFDGVADFSAVTEDPANPGHLLPTYDTDSTVGGPGDHLHPNRAGFLSVGGVVDVSQVLPFALYPAAPRGLCARCARPCRYSRAPDTLTGVTIVPDAKDWTWVLHRTCPECGFDTRSFPRAAVPYLLRENAAAWSAVLARPGDLRRRPRPDVWSPLEYACHVRDVFRIYAYRLHLMLSEDDPTFPNWDQDATAVVDRYPEQDPATVRKELTVAAEKLAAGFAAVQDGAWDRTGTRSDGAGFTVESFARYLMHDPVHHLYDVTGEPAAVRRPET